jgi:peroxiredoxin
MCGVEQPPLQRENRLSFPILSDPHNDVADLCKNAFKKDLEVVNGDDSWTLPMPAPFVIGRDGIIHYVEVNPDYTRRPDPSELFPILDGLRAREAA